MKLSEAIRIGASWSHKTSGVMKDSKGGTCAMGAAYEGVFGTIDDTDISDSNIMGRLIETFPELQKEVSVPRELTPGLWTSVSFLSRVIMTLNDSTTLTRDQIADYVEKLEIENGWTGTKEITKQTEELTEVVCGKN